MDRALSSLSSDFYPLACELIARLIEQRVQIVIVETRRTLAEHQLNLANGTSGTTLSLHLPRQMRWPPSTPLRQQDIDKSDAMDLCPYEIFNAHGPSKLNWNAHAWEWGVIGREAEALGLRWGGRWRVPFDPGHVEIWLPWRLQYKADELRRPWPHFDTRNV
jgi:hypothetical protein